MERRTLGKTGLEVSVLGFGGAPVGFLDTEQKQITRILNALLDEGVNLIDTAASYPGSEEAIGKAVGHRRDEYVLVSKCGQAFDGLPGGEWSAEVVTHTIDRALRRLATDHLDVMLLHSCDLETWRRGEALAALVAAREAGKIRFAGYSGDNEAAAHAAAHEDVAVLETSINIADQANIDAALPAAREHNVGVIVKRPIANAAWKNLSEQPGMYADYARTYTERLAQMGVSPETLNEDGRSADWPELALRFTLSQPGVHTAIIGTTNVEHARANLAAAREPLSEATIQSLREAFRRAESAAGESWRGET
jgi:aryl-alcohol dehydrogenase-like predicted oxidoreductase